MHYSNAGHHISQVNTSDQAGIEAAFTDLIGAYVASQQNTKPRVPRTTDVRPDDGVLCGTRIPVTPILPQNNVQKRPTLGQLSDKGVQLNAPTTSVVKYPCGQNPSAGGNKLAQQRAPNPLAASRQLLQESEPGAFCCPPAPSAESGNPGVFPQAAAVPERDPFVLVDCELGRLARLRLETRQFVLWLYAHRFADGEGRITRDELCTRCVQLGITSNRRTFNRWLTGGAGIYWRERGGYLYLTGWRKLSARLTKHAAKFHPERISTNLPGQQRVRLDLTGSLQSVHANLYGGWITAKAHKTGYLDISRYTLGILHGVSTQTMLAYEKRLGIRVEERYAEHHDIHSKLIPAHATLHIDIDGREFASWRISNRYSKPSEISIHPHAGQRKKIRAACKRTVETFTPADTKPGGFCRITRTGRTTFHNKRGKRGFILAYTQISRHLRKHQDADLRPHYAYMTHRYGKVVYEMTTGAAIRSADMGIDFDAERTGEFELRRMGYRQQWAGRVGVKGF